MPGYAAEHARLAAARLLADPDALPFMHLGEFDSVELPVTATAFQAAQLRLSERTLALASDGDVLEVGCGLGANLALRSRQSGRGRLVGLDLGRLQLTVARQLRVGRRIDWLEGDATRLPFGAATFDAVFAVECAFHFSSRLAFARQAQRVLRPSGRLVLTDLVAGRPVADSDDAALEAYLRAELAPFPEFAGGDWASLADAVGLVVSSTEDLTRRIAPSFELILAGKARDPARLPPSSDDRGVAALARALSTGLLRMERWVLAASS